MIIDFIFGFIFDHPVFSFFIVVIVVAVCVGRYLDWKDPV